MNALILADAQVKPHVFRWNGPVDSRDLLEWVQGHEWRIPQDLMDYWAMTGGGFAFESERFLKPLVPADDDDGVEQVTDWFVRHGMPKGLVVFHEGLAVTAVRNQDGAYLTFDENAQVLSRHVSLDAWYVEVLRAEYASRYGLPPL